MSTLVCVHTIVLNHSRSFKMSSPAAYTARSRTSGENLFDFVMAQSSQSVEPPQIRGGSLAGRVVGLSDGDTLTVLDERDVQHKIRLTGIDAPEKRQDYGNKSRQYLAALVFDKHVSVEWDKKDRYGRFLGKVVVDGRDVNLAMVSAGLAWHYKRYKKEQSVSDRQVYAEAELRARVERRGLWQLPNPVPPWDFRRGAR